MAECMEEQIRVWHRDGREHRLLVAFGHGQIAAMVGAMYEGGCANVATGTTVAVWQVTYEPPNEWDDGQVWIGNGRIDIEVEELRGIGLGSLLMLPLVRWAKQRPGNVPVVPISLAEPDAKTDDERDRRNGFYEKLGFEFDYKDDRIHGSAREMLASKLVIPPFKMSRKGGWSVESLSPTSSVFQAV